MIVGKIEKDGTKDVYALDVNLGVNGECDFVIELKTERDELYRLVFNLDDLGTLTLAIRNATEQKIAYLLAQLASGKPVNAPMPMDDASEFNC